MTEAARPTPTDHRRKPKPQKVGLASITETDTYASCSCGWDSSHRRKKVLTRRVDEHVKAKHPRGAIYQ